MTTQLLLLSATILVLVSSEPVSQLEEVDHESFLAEWIRLEDEILEKQGALQAIPVEVVVDFSSRRLADADADLFDIVGTLRLIRMREGILWPQVSDSVGPLMHSRLPTKRFHALATYAHLADSEDKVVAIASLYLGDPSAVVRGYAVKLLTDIDSDLSETVLSVWLEIQKRLDRDRRLDDRWIDAVTEETIRRFLNRPAQDRLSATFMYGRHERHDCPWRLKDQAEFA